MSRRWLWFGTVTGISVACIAVVGWSPSLAQREDPTEAYIIASQRQDSRLKLKQILLALHNYHTQHNEFPAGTRPSSTLKPEQRLSWMTAILPDLDQQQLAGQLVADKGWDDKVNRQAVMTTLDVFLNPGLERPKPGDLSVTQYVGLAGLGADGPTLPVDSPRAGCFAYDRPTRLTDIKDGTSNTIMVSEASKDFGLWAAGGRPTLRSLTKGPVLNGPDGIGGPWKEGTLVAFADGSVRFVAKAIDPKLFKAVVTINGHEKVNIH
jgi:Protein of unknown function (DUF1559)